MNAHPVSGILDQEAIVEYEGLAFGAFLSLAGGCIVG